MVNKIVTPIIHALFLVPMLFIAMGSIELMARRFELLPDYIRLFELPSFCRSEL
jgi:hypothetical protein